MTVRFRPITLALTLILVTLGRIAHAEPAANDDYAAARARMLTVIQANAEAVGSAPRRAGISQGVLDVMGRVPRHEFVPEDLRGSAYDDRPLPIGFGQTISQPYIVALMTDLLELEPGDTVLEVGTGSGYQAAILAPLAARVFTIEIVPQLAEAAKDRLARLHYDNVTVGAVQRHRRYRRGEPHSAAVDPAVAAGRPHGHSGRRSVLRPAPDARRKARGRHGYIATTVAGAFRAAGGQPLRWYG
jgi:protein-L-isoaspartate(D-aspartate) O-methyltransferase